MKKLHLIAILPFLLAACANPLALPPAAPNNTAVPVPVASPSFTPSFTPEPSLSPSPYPSITPVPTAVVTVTPAYPSQGYGPSDFPPNIDPLTGLKVLDASLLERRPLLIKVANLPRAYRPQWGLSLADQVFEYYIEEGTTRFAAVFLGQDASMVGPVRSGRFFDNHLINMYKADFAFGSADYRVRNLFYNQSYADRLVIESGCPPMCRFEPNSLNYLMANTSGLTTLINNRNVKGGNGRQNLNGFLFSYNTPTQGYPARRIYIRYSSAIYNRWDYNPDTGRYERFSDTADDFQGGAGEKYKQLTDRLTNQPISADNVVVLFVSHAYYLRKPEIVDIVMSGPGDAYLFRDGSLFALKWYRNGINKTPILVDPAGKTFPLKPGNTWFEIVGSSSEVHANPTDYRFIFKIP